MVYEKRQKKKSDFITDDAISDSSTFDFIKAGVNKKTSFLNFKSSISDSINSSTESYATLKAITGQLSNQVTHVSFRVAEDDGGGGPLRWDDSDHSITGTNNVSNDPEEILFIAPNYDPTGRNGAWIRQHEGVINSRWAGFYPGATDSVNATAINAAIQYCQTNNYTLYTPPGTYDVDDVIYIDGNIVWNGAYLVDTIIRKTNTAVGTGSNTFSGQTDSYAINAIVILRHGDGDSSERIWMSHLSFRDKEALPSSLGGSDSPQVEYGIAAYRTSNSDFVAVDTDGAKIGFYTRNSFVTTMQKCTFNCRTIRGIPGQTDKGWPDGASIDDDTYAVWWDDNGSGASTGTSLVMTNVYARECHVGYKLHSLQYSTLNSCTADFISKRPYWLRNSSDIVLNGCGTERAGDGIAYYWQGGSGSMNGCHSRAIAQIQESSTNAMLLLNNADVVSNACNFAEYDTENTATITNITATNPAVITLTGHGFSNGQTVYIEDTGVSAIDDIKHVISNATTNTFEIPVDGTGWTSGGKVINTNWNFNVLVQNSSNLVQISGSLPSNGNADPSLTSGSSYHKIERYGKYRLRDASNNDGREEIMQTTRRQTAAELADIADDCNTNGKFPGLVVWDSTNSRPVWAVNDTAGSVWVYSDGTTAHTPV